MRSRESKREGASSGCATLRSSQSTPSGCGIGGVVWAGEELFGLAFLSSDRFAGHACCIYFFLLSCESERVVIVLSVWNNWRYRLLGMMGWVMTPQLVVYENHGKKDDTIYGNGAFGGRQTVRQKLLLVGYL